MRHQKEINLNQNLKKKLKQRSSTERFEYTTKEHHVNIVSDNTKNIPI